MKIKKNGKVIRLTESDLKRILKRVLTEKTLGGCKCDDGSIDEDCCPEEMRRNYINSVTKNAEYFKKNPKGTITMKPKSTGPLELMINGTKDGVNVDGDSPYYGKLQDFNDLWDFNGGGRGFRTGSTGKFNYTYENGEILITPAPGNEGQSHGQIAGECGCSYELKPQRKKRRR